MSNLIFIWHQIITFLKSVKAVLQVKNIYPEKFISMASCYITK